MDPDISDAVTEWEPVAAGSGVAGLRSLAADDFSGAVTDGLTWAFFLNGRIVGVFDGTLDAFEGTDLTAYRAPDPSLPLLFSMRETGGETRGQYYTEETPLADVDRKLSSGKFTGYVELSENVLSGDYYMVYHGGRSMNVAFVGASERLVTEDEAFELAADEVGIYTVTAVDVEVTDIPGDDAAGASDAGGVAAVGTADEVDDDPTTETGVEADADTDSDDEPASEVTFGGAASSDASADDATDDDALAGGESYAASDDLTGDMGIGLNVGGDSESSSEAESPGYEVESPGHEAESQATDVVDEADETDEADERERPHDEPSEEDPAVDNRDHTDDDVAVDGSEDVPDAGDAVDDAGDAEREAGSTGPAPTETEAAESSVPAESDGREPSASTTEPTGIDTEVTNGKERGVEDGTAVHGIEAAESAADDSPSDEYPEPADAGQRSAETDADDEPEVFSAERQWQETRRIPALSPDETMDEESSAGQSAAGQPAAVAQQVRDEPSETASEADTPEEQSRETPSSSSRPASTSDASADEDTEATRELEARLASVTEERDALAARVESLESDLEGVTRERDKFRVRIADLESEIERLQTAVDRQSSGSGSDGPHLSPSEARKGTNLFVRYRSKGKPTLEKARTGDAKQSDVVDNLRIEYHTTFENESATVDGTPYEEFLGETTEWSFVTWMVEELLYEIGRAGHRTSLAPLFDAIPEIDRIQFDGEVPVTVEEGGKDVHESRTFDLVFWNSMGDPLFVVDVDTDRSATTQNMVGSLIDGARAVGTTKETLSGAFYVSNSFFDPGALDAIGEATKSGLLSRDSKKSFVKLSRKDGYHLCLVEARSGEFHLTVPEL